LGFLGIFPEKERWGRVIMLLESPILLTSCRVTVPKKPENGKVLMHYYRLQCDTNTLHCIYNSIIEPKMPPKKTTTLNLRIDPALKEAIRQAAVRENRSVANMVETLIRRHCDSVGIQLPEQQSQDRGEGGDG
jgi:hypothetical protein